MGGRGVVWESRVWIVLVKNGIRLLFCKDGLFYVGLLRKRVYYVLLEGNEEGWMFGADVVLWRWEGCYWSDV